MIREEVTRGTDEILEFKNGAALEVVANDAHLVRGRSVLALLGTEASFWNTDPDAKSSDEEVVGAAEPGMAMVPDGGLMILSSSVHRKKGLMYRRWKELHGNDDAEDICWLAAAEPSLPASGGLATNPAEEGQVRQPSSRPRIRSSTKLCTERSNDEIVNASFNWRRP
jgi:hypothetical protein